MKLKNLIFLMLGVLFWTACSDEDPSTEQSGPRYSLQSVVNNVTAESVDIILTPSDLNTTFFAKVVETKSIKDLTPSVVVGTMLNSTDFQENIHIGNFQQTVKGLLPQTEYTLVSFVWNEQKAYDFKLTPFTTLKKAEEGGVGNGKFTMSSLEPSYTSVKVRIVPDNPDKEWYYYVMKKVDYDYYLAGEGTHGPVIHCYYGWNNIAVEGGMNISKYLTSLSFKGSKDLYVTKLLQNTEYVMLVMYVDITQDNPTVVYDFDALQIPFATQKATTQAPVIEVVNSGVQIDAEGNYNIFTTVRTNAAFEGRCCFSPVANWDPEVFDPNDPQAAFTIANMFGTPITSKQREALLSGEGCTFYKTLSPADYQETAPYYFGIWVADEQGNRTTKVILVGEN